MSSGFFSKIIKRVKKWCAAPATKRFMLHNKKIFALAAPASGRKPIILMELNAAHSTHIAYSYLVNAIVEQEQAQVVAYAPYSLGGWRNRMYFNIEKVLGVEVFGVFKSFGTSGFINVVLEKSQKLAAKELFAKVTGELKNKQDIVDLTISGVWIGDLVYDTFLRKHNVPTIQPTSSLFRDHLTESIELFVFWQNYFDNHDVRAINVSHCVYNLAMPMRIAVQRDIPAFQTNVSHIYRLSKKNLFAYNDFVYFREQFAALPAQIKKPGLEQARIQIKRRFDGEIGVDMSYSSRSAYTKIQHKRLLRKSTKIKLLIATHCFFDSPHSYGKNLFPDFYDWLDFLGEMTNLTDHDWYIKTHPDYLPGTMEIIEGFIKRFPKFTLLPADASHHQIIADGIDVALTTYGTIGFEYAALGIPVINASVNNPHIGYDFNLHPTTITEYRALLLDIENVKLKIDKQQVYEYYFMKHIFEDRNIFFKNYAAMEKRVGGYAAQFTPKVYDAWLDDFSAEKHTKIQTALIDFLRSDDFRMISHRSGDERLVQPRRENA